ncbi:MAG TPA: sigma-70 family RNA polymerase sigma factor [Candidatus Methylacidiphilales bacterium]|nr:sigma-70 family RNA polymerase sigma factor [Candidatus Methylacidiphilales bacterium]
MENPRERGDSLPARQQFEEAFLPHLDAAYNLARWLLRNDQDAEDCVQDAYLRAYKAFPRFRGGDGKAWLMTIVRNVCYTAIRKLRRHETPESFDENIHQATDDTATTEEFRQKANAETLRRGLERLPPEFREMIVLHDLEGHSYKEIAAIVAVPIGTVMSRLARAREKLRVEIIAISTKEISYEL